MNPPRPAVPVPESFILGVRSRLEAGHRVRRTLPGWGRIHVDRPLPFLCVYRNADSDPGTARLVTSEASYVMGSGRRADLPGLSHLVREVAEVLVAQFGSCLVIELWAGEPPSAPERPVSGADLVPGFRILAPRGAGHAAFTDDLQTALSRVRYGQRRAKVEVHASTRPVPEGFSPILPHAVADQIGAHVYGLEVAPIYRNSEGEVFPGVLRTLARRVTIALRRAFFEFASKYTTHRPPHYLALGRRAVVKAVWEVDRQLAEASDQYDFLLQVTPVNAEQAWNEFHRGKFERRPAFHYRPLATEPVVLKRNLYRAPVERVEDPALGQILREQLVSIDRQITMLQDRGSPRFLYESLQLFGGVDDELFGLARKLLERIPARSREPTGGETLDAESFARRARDEIEFLRERYGELASGVEVRPDITGLMVSRGRLLVGADAAIPESRVDALLQHEVGTHVVTYFNGKAQRFRQLAIGLAGYDALQEGLAVLAEYAVGGLSRPRLRLLAGRVLAVRHMVDGATFVDTFRELTRTHGFAQRTAFTVALRVYRGGGLTKDAVYLRGLAEILEYIVGGGELEPLFVGKIAARHIPIVRELRWRGVLKDPPLLPRYLEAAEAAERLAGLRQGATVLDLIEKKRKKKR
jgi:uncharacterized protein (TIGR02421 family)